MTPTETSALFLSRRDCTIQETSSYWPQNLIGENNLGVAEAPSIKALIIEWPGNHETLIAHLDEQPDPIPVRRVTVELSTDQFIGLFKRFGVVIYAAISV